MLQTAAKPCGSAILIWWNMIIFILGYNY